MSDPDDIINRRWDAIVIGTGMGGATLGYALARAGKRVLFCEKGRSHLDTRSALRGDYAESYLERSEVPQARHREILSRAGRCIDEVEDQSLPHFRTFVPFLGSGTGGSSALYGMALERFFPTDFSPRRNFPSASDSTLPEEWPISYDTLAPYYAAAEKLFRVRGGTDALRGESSPEHLLPPPAFTPGSVELLEFLQQRGLHPYRLPMASEFVAGCQCCQGYLCAKNCKNDSSRMSLSPAIANHGAQLLDECDVLRLEATRDTVTGVVCSWRGKQVHLHGRIVVLAAGALQTPSILFSSSSTIWPRGLANDSGMLGRNLMRHYVDLYLIPAKTQGQLENRQKELAFNDFYQMDGEKLGTVQSFGRLPPPAMLVESMEQDIRDGRSPWIAPFFRLAKPFVKPFLGRLVNRSMVLATIMEDLPYEDNMVSLPPDRNESSSRRIAIQYRIRPHDMERIETFRSLMKDALKPYRVTMIKAAENNQRIAHVCGTCRFGSDPVESVLNSCNRAHALSNLYVVDSSFFPSSGGTNPGLTIAANALRVAEHIVDELP